MRGRIVPRGRSLRRDGRRLCGGCLRRVAAQTPERTCEPAPAPAAYIDVHTHIGQVWNTTRELTAKGLLDWMDANDVAQAVVLPVVSPEASSYPLTPDFVLAQTGRTATG